MQMKMMGLRTMFDLEKIPQDTGTALKSSPFATRPVGNGTTEGGRGFFHANLV